MFMGEVEMSYTWIFFFLMFIQYRKPVWMIRSKFEPELIIISQ